MTVQELLKQMAKLDIQLFPEGDTLRYSAPEGSLDDNLREQLIRHKPEILAALRQFTVTYYEDNAEQWFKTIDGKFWHLDKRTGVKTQMVPGNPSEDKPLSHEFFESFGSLLGTIISRRIQ